jgi:hypothetical protein
VVDVAHAIFTMPLSMEETTPAPPSTGMGSSARSCGRSRLPSSDLMTVRAADPGGAMHAVAVIDLSTRGGG